MTGKAMVIYWSDAAVKMAGDTLPAVQQAIMVQCREIIDETHDWFFHVVTREADGPHYLCNGKEDEENWRVFVQLARYELMAPLPDDHPDPERRGKVFKMPVPDEVEGNDAYREIGLIH